MAKKTSGSSNDSVVRIKASSTKSTATKKADSAVKADVKASAPKEPKTTRKNPWKAFTGYFKGAWYELRQVHWPTRKATWGLTVAVLIFTFVMMLVIVLLDLLFNYGSKVLLGS